MTFGSIEDLSQLIFDLSNREVCINATDREQVLNHCSRKAGKRKRM
jgi:hypothetical protein